MIVDPCSDDHNTPETGLVPSQIGEMFIELPEYTEHLCLYRRRPPPAPREPDEDDDDEDGDAAPERAERAAPAPEPVVEWYELEGPDTVCLVGDRIMAGDDSPEGAGGVTITIGWDGRTKTQLCNGAHARYRLWRARPLPADGGWKPVPVDERAMTGDLMLGVRYTIEQYVRGDPECVFDIVSGYAGRTAAEMDGGRWTLWRGGRHRGPVGGDAPARRIRRRPATGNPLFAAPLPLP